MAKKHVKGKDGKKYVMKEKKPFYKKWWFIAIMVIVVIGVIGSLGGGNKSNKNKNGGQKVTQSETKSKEKKSAEKEFYGIGDSVDVGGVVYTLNSVETTDERNEFDDKKPENVIKVSYTMENKNEKDVPVGMDVSAYGPDSKKLESYPNDNTMGSVAKDKKIDVVQHFGLNELGEVELQFAPLVSIKDTADFKVNVE